MLKASFRGDVAQRAVGLRATALGPILLGMSLAAWGIWHSLKLGSALSGWRADCHEHFLTTEVRKTFQVPFSGAGSICWRMQVVPERQGRSWEFSPGSQTLPHPINTTGLCLHPPALGKRPSLRLNALVLAGASTGTRMALREEQRMGGKWKSGLRWKQPQRWEDCRE